MTETQRITSARALLVVFAGAVLVITAMKNRTLQVSDPQRQHVVLVGASIGQAWDLAGWPVRAAAPQFSAESVAAWQFDKSAALQETLMRPKRRFRLTRTYIKSWFQPAPRRPDIVIVKECSSYFPGNADLYLNQVRDWVRQIRAHHAVPILATVVPVTRARSARDPGKQDSLLEYNWRLRGYAQEQKIPILDLESALGEPAEGSFLRDEFTSGDGSHLNAKAYAVLDRTLRDTLCAIPTANASNLAGETLHGIR